MVNLLQFQARTVNGGTQDVYVNQQDPVLQQLGSDPQNLELCIDAKGNVYAGKKDTRQAIKDLGIED